MGEQSKLNFPKLLKYYLSMNDMSQKDLADKLDVQESTVSMWCNGSRVPPMKRIAQIAETLNITTSDLVTNEESNDNSYYLNDDTREMARFMFDNPEYKVLFDATRNVKKEDIEFVKEMIDRLNK